MPGETIHSQTFVDTAVFDVATKKLLFRAPGAAILQKDHSFVGKADKIRALRNASFKKAVNKMTDHLQVKLEIFKERVKESKVVNVSYRNGYSGGGSYGWFGLVFLILLIRFSQHK